MSRFLWISILCVGLDQASKLWILEIFSEYEVQQIWPVFNLTLVYNKGAAFSFLADAGGWQEYFFIALSSIISLIIIIWLLRLKPNEKLTAWSLSFIIGGAVGNLIDRVAYGKVVDFLQWHWQDWYFPSFNVADAAITLGVVLLLIESFKPETVNS